MSNSWDMFIVFVRSIPNHRKDDESLKEYFYKGWDDNGKAMLDNIPGGSYGECIFEEIIEKLEKISRNNKHCTLESQTLVEAISIQVAPSQSNDDSQEDMTQVSTYLGLN